MIPAQNIVAWGAVVPWADQRQVEQDLIIGRALVEIFSDDVLRAMQCGFVAGQRSTSCTFPKPMRYSEDIDLVRTSGGPIGPHPRSTACRPGTVAGASAVRSKSRSHRSFASGSKPKTAAACRSG